MNKHNNSIIDRVSDMSFDELQSELHTQEIIYSTEKDTCKANAANLMMTILLNEICNKKKINQELI